MFVSARMGKTKKNPLHSMRCIFCLKRKERMRKKETYKDKESTYNTQPHSMHLAMKISISKKI